MCPAFYQMFQINWDIEGLARPFTVTLHAFQSEETGKDNSRINNLKTETERHVLKKEQQQDDRLMMNVRPADI